MILTEVSALELARVRCVVPGLNMSLVTVEW